MAGLKNKLDEVFHQTFRKLVEDIAITLKEKKQVQVSESFAVVMVKIVSLDPENKFLIKQPIVRSELERMKKVVIERILGMTPISRNIIRMQLHYLGNHFTRLELVKAHRTELEDQIAVLLNDITIAIPKHQRHYDLFYKKLVAAAILKAGMGPSSEYMVVKETEAALGSVFPKEDINLLTTMPVHDREVELRHLMKMAAGIRLYNRDIGPVDDSVSCGVGIADLLTIIPEKIQACLTLLTDMRERNIDRLIMYTSLIRPYFLMDNPNVNKIGRRDIAQEMVWVRQGLTMVHQLLIHLKEISDELNEEKKLVGDLIKRYDLSMEDLKKTITENDSVSTFIVYPKFVELANSWENLQESLDYIETTVELIQKLEEFSESDLKEIDPLVQNALGPDHILKKDEFFEFPEYEMPVDQYALAQISPFTLDLDPLNTEYCGFCVWSLVKGLGLVLLSNPNIGVFRWRGHQYLFSTPEAAADFRRDPDVYIYKAIQVARRWPELIYLLKLDFASFNPDYIAEADRAASAVAPLISREAEIQTDLHPLDTNIVPGYTWNEWELRRQAIILSKIHKCATHSTQTHWQALKKTQSIQTYPLKNIRVQTDTNIHVEAPRNQFWFYGLRGFHCGVPPHILELSKEATQDMKCKRSNIHQSDKNLPPTS